MTRDVGTRVENGPGARALALDSLRAIVELRQTLDRLERIVVGRARQHWASWEAIGTSLGISRQAACARHRAVTETDGDSPGDSPRPSA
ncbi:MAG TPA: hypothetical protein VIA10_16210 [Gaiellaceae bacterium]|jgi:hypothetical protein